MSVNDELLAAQRTFSAEAVDLLEDMESGLLELEAGGDAASTLNSIFRAAHTIKGSSGLFGMDHVVRFTHVVETVLDRMREGDLPVTPDLVGALLPCKDHIADLIETAADGADALSPEQDATGRRLHDGLLPWLGGDVTADPEPGPVDPGSCASADPGPAGSVEPTTAGEGPGAPRIVHVSIRFGADCLRGGMDPLAFVRYLATFGEIRNVGTIGERVTALAGLDPESCCVAFEVTMLTDAERAAVADVFEFVADESDIRVLEPTDPISEWVDLVHSYGEQATAVADVLVAHGVLTATALREGLAESLGASLTADGIAGPGAGEAATRAQASEALEAVPDDGPQEAVAAPDLRVGVPGAVVPGQREAVHERRSGDERRSGKQDTVAVAGDSRTIRVDASRLDRLVDSVGELVIAGAGANLRTSTVRDEALDAAMAEVMRLIEEVRDSALQLRMVPIGTTFGRFQRIVRDVSASLGKDVQLVVTGGDTEVDKALVEQIGDPLVHLVRNSLDHGIEPAHVRRERGKPERGTLRLNAFHDSGSIVIEVSDDGGGIDRDRVLAKAVSRGLVEPGAELTDKEVSHLIFEPGFSTAEAVSDLSGRGVGMDVVKSNVTALRGTIEVDSVSGQGTTTRITLPLTLAIIDGFLVGVADATYVIPLDRVVECVGLSPEHGNHDCVDLRGEVLPLIRLRATFAEPGARPRRENIVVVEHAGARAGLVVDTLMGEFQTVIKPLGALFEHVEGIGGSTILGNGDVALIIDVPMLVRHAERTQGARVG